MSLPSTCGRTVTVLSARRRAHAFEIDRDVGECALWLPAPGQARRRGRAHRRAGVARMGRNRQREPATTRTPTTTRARFRRCLVIAAVWIPPSISSGTTSLVVTRACIGMMVQPPPSAWNRPTIACSRSSRACASTSSAWNNCLLRYEHRDQVDGALAQARLGNVEGALRARDRLALQHFAPGALTDSNQGTIDVDEARDHRFPVKLQQLPLPRFLLVRTRRAAGSRRGSAASGRRRSGRRPTPD